MKFSQKLPLLNLTASGAPTVGDDSARGYSVGSIWKSGSGSYRCTDATVGAAVWVPEGGATSWGSIDGNINDQIDLQDGLSEATDIAKDYTDQRFIELKDTSGGYAGLTLFKINFKNALNTFTSFFTNANTAARTYTFPDKDGTVAMLDDITGVGLDEDGVRATEMTGTVFTDTTAPTAADTLIVFLGRVWANILRVLSGWQTLTDGTTVPLNAGNKQNVLAKLSSSQSFTFDMTNVADGSTILIKIVKTITPDITITFDTDFTNISDAGAFPTYVFSGAINAEEIIVGIVDGTQIHWRVKASSGGGSLPAGTAGQVIVYNSLNAGTATNMTGDVTITDAGVTAIGANKVTFAKFVQVSARKFLGNMGVSTANVQEIDPQDLVVTDATVQSSLNSSSGWDPLESTCRHASLSIL